MRCFHKLVSGLVNGGPDSSSFFSPSSLCFALFRDCLFLLSGLVYMDGMDMEGYIE
jgi:hypothetical protein